MRIPTRNKLLLLGDLAFFYLSLVLTLLFRGGPALLERLWRPHLLPFSILCVVWLAVFYAHDLYSVRRSRLNADFFQTLSQAMLINALATAAFFYFFRGFGITPKANLALYLAIFGLLVVLWRLIVGRCLAGGRDREPVLFFEPAARLRPIIERLAADASADQRLAGVVPAAGGTADYGPEIAVHDGREGLERIVRETGATTIVVDEAVLRARGEIFSGLLMPGVTVVDAATFWEQVSRQSPLEIADPAWFVAAFRGARRPAFELFKRAIDSVCATAGLVILSWLMLFIAAAVKISSKGAVLYAQRRVGLNGKPFILFKFRTMVADAESSEPRWAAKDDPRVTPVGRVLRHAHLDELPQLWNIVRGEMSFVGPRPERPEFVATLQHDVPYYSLRHLVKPGLTGWAQVNYRYGSSVADAARKLAYDLYYVRRRSPLLDMTVMIRTAGALFRGEGR